MRIRKRIPRLLSLAIAGLLAGAVGIPGSALAQTPTWYLGSETSPTNLIPGKVGQVLVVASDLGDEPIDGTLEPVTISARLPVDLVATTISGGAAAQTNGNAECSVATLKCTFKGVLYPYEQIVVRISVTVKAQSGMLSGEAGVQVGGVSAAMKKLVIPVSNEPAGYGVAGFEQELLNANGAPATHAGAHPFQLTTTLALNQSNPPGSPYPQPVELPKDLSFQLPRGLVGNPTAATQCPMTSFFAFVLETNLCPPSAVVGVATVTADEPKALKVFTVTVPVFNLVPAKGEPARFGIDVAGVVPIVLDTAVRSGRDYGVDVTVKEATETAGLLSSQVTFWGVPGDPRHDNARGWECVAGGHFVAQIGRSCPVSSGLPEEPFLRTPTSCAVDPEVEPVVFAMGTDSWAHPGTVVGAEYEWMSGEGELLGFEGCGGLPFGPSIDVTPEQHTASTPTGLDVSVKVPQTTTLKAGQPAEADVRDTTVTLPEGVMLSPSAANGLEACSERQVGFTGFDQTTQTNEFDTAPVSCPDGSKVGTVRIKTPLLSHELKGGVYLASPAPNGASEPGRNPFNSLMALYIVAEDPVSGVLVKLAGEGQLDESTLRITTTFHNTPQVPFEELSMHLFGGERGSVTTPPLCGLYLTDAVFTPWSGTGPVSRPTLAGDFEITQGVGGAECPGDILFSPGFAAGGESVQAGAFTTFNLKLSRSDGDQALSRITMHLPPGIAALLASVELCSETQAVASACPPGSEVGKATAFAGLGSEPYVQTGGKVFITGRYEDAPFGLEIVTPAKAGPFDLGYVTVRSKLYIDPTNASVTIVSDPLPTQIKGIPLQLKRVLVSVDRPGFEFNPTNCKRMTIEGIVTGSSGTEAGVSSPFEAGGCQNLQFAPQLTASAVGHGSKADGTTFAVTVRSGGVNSNGVAQAGIAKVELQLPKQLSSRLPTLQKACVDTVFNVNPASCDEGSVIGYATIHTPVLKNPLTGPAYLVSHGGAAFPDVEFVLQGEGIKLVLDGQTDIKGELTYSKFESTPDAPFTVFETVLPAGPHGVLTPNVAESKRFSLCGETLLMPTTMIAQNGKRIDQGTKVQVTGCGEVRGVQTTKKLTLKQKLRRSLRSCRHRYKHAKLKRVKCEHEARARYTRKALTACRRHHEHATKKRQACERAARKQLAAKHAHPARHAAGKSQGAKG
jgi:hypothetical protein